jgi:hypothetical protein
MQLEYFDDPQSRSRPVLLTYGDDPSEAALLRNAIEPLARGDSSHRVQVDTLPGFHGVDGCSLIAQVTSSNLGVVRIERTDSGFLCTLDAATWWQVSGLLEPFTESTRPDGRSIHQYLSSDGPIEWIISTSRQW